jgi:hypothetical protein
LFKAKITLSFLILLIFLIVTSIIKNQTRGLEKKIIQLNNKISLNEKDLNESQFDFFYLSSPDIIEKKINNLGKNNYLPMRHSEIFLNFSSFTNIQNKITILKRDNEKKIKTN